MILKHLVVCFGLATASIVGLTETASADYLPYSGNPAYDRYVYQQNYKIYQQRLQQQYQQRYQPRTSPNPSSNYANLLYPAYVLGSGGAVGEWCARNRQQCNICWNNYSCRQQMLNLVTNPVDGANSAYEYYRPKPQQKPQSKEECFVDGGGRIWGLNCSRSGQVIKK